MFLRVSRIYGKNELFFFDHVPLALFFCFWLIYLSFPQLFFWQVRDKSIDSMKMPWHNLACFDTKFDEVTVSQRLHPTSFCQASCCKVRCQCNTPVVKGHVLTVRRENTILKEEGDVLGCEQVGILLPRFDRVEGMQDHQKLSTWSAFVMRPATSDRPITVTSITRSPAATFLSAISSWQTMTLVTP